MITISLGACCYSPSDRSSIMLQMLKIPEVFSTILGPKVGSNATEKKVKEDDKDKKKKDEGDGEGKEKDGEEAKTREDKKKEDEKKKKRAASGRSGPGSGRERGGSGDGDDPDGHIRYVSYTAVFGDSPKPRD